MAACLREAADMIDPDLWIPTMDCEGVSVHREHALWLVEQTLESCEPQAFPFIDATYGTPECITLTTDLLCERNDGYVTCRVQHWKSWSRHITKGSQNELR